MAAGAGVGVVVTGAVVGPVTTRAAGGAVSALAGGGAGTAATIAAAGSAAVGASSTTSVAPTSCFAGAAATRRRNVTRAFATSDSRSTVIFNGSLTVWIGGAGIDAAGAGRCATSAAGSVELAERSPYARPSAPTAMLAPAMT